MAQPLLLFSALLAIIITLMTVDYLGLPRLSNFTNYYALSLTCCDRIASHVVSNRFARK